MNPRRTVENILYASPLLRDALERGHVQVAKDMLGPAWRGYVAQVGKAADQSAMRAAFDVRFDWKYLRDMPEMTRLYEAAKESQWNASTAFDWSRPIDEGAEGEALLPDDFIPVSGFDGWKHLSPAMRAEQRRAILAWLLSQFLHGEQGALMAAAQVTESVPWLDAKLYGSTQVVDEGRHVEVFHRYLTEKLGKLYHINDNLYVIIDALMLSESWDMKFLGMQIMIEGLALGAFGTIRCATQEPLLREVLRYVITDEARHVHFGVVSLQKLYADGLTESERRYREEWALEVSVTMRNRFLAHEFYEEYYAHTMTRREWDELALASPLMSFFRTTLFKRIVPNLKRLGLLSPRVRRHYEALGVLKWESGKSAPELTADDLLRDEAMPGSPQARETGS